MRIAAALTGAAVVALVASGCGRDADGSAATSSVASAFASAGGGSVSPRPIVPSPTASRPVAHCPTDLGASAVRVAVAGLSAPPAPPGASWDADPRSFFGDYAACDELSVAIVPVRGGTASSYEDALLFHHDVYLGPASGGPHPMITLDAPETTPDTVVLDYHTPGTCDACADGTTVAVRFRWNGTGVDTIGEIPR
jgi:hypothetical protein